MLDKAYSTVNNITKDNEYNFTMIKISINQADIIILSVYGLQASKCMKQNLIKDKKKSTNPQLSQILIPIVLLGRQKLVRIQKIRTTLSN